MTTEQSKLPAESLGKRIRFLRTQAGLTQDDLAKELNVTRQALSNWERDVNLPDLPLLQQICGIFGVHIDELLLEVMNMEITSPQSQTMASKPKRFNKYDVAIGLFYAIGLFLGLGIFFVGGLLTMTPMGWSASLFGGGCTALVLGLLAHAIITLKRQDR